MDACELALQPARHGHVVGVEARDVRPARIVQAAVQRAGETDLLTVAQHAQARVVDAREDLRSRVDGRVVDDHDFEIRDRLTEDARERSPDVFLAVVDGDERGDERGGGHYVP